MKTFFSIRLKDSVPAVADVSHMYGKVYMVNRINVPAAHRRQGYGGRLLRELCFAADQDHVTLVLYPVASGDMPQDELIAWYSRNGFSFVWEHQWFARPPVPTPAPTEKEWEQFAKGEGL